MSFRYNSGALLAISKEMGFKKTESHHNFISYCMGQESLLLTCFVFVNIMIRL